jgi:hypothetical protein
MSRATQDTAVTRPASSQMGEQVTVTWSIVPLRWRRTTACGCGLFLRDHAAGDLLAVTVARRHQQREPLAQDLVGRKAEHGLGARVPAENRSVQRPAHDGVDGGADNGGQQPQPLFLLPAFGHVPPNAAVAFEAANLVEYRLTADRHVVLVSGEAAHAVFELLERLARGQRAGVLFALLPDSQMMGSSKRVRPYISPITSRFSPIPRW